MYVWRFHAVGCHVRVVVTYSRMLCTCGGDSLFMKSDATFRKSMLSKHIADVSPPFGVFPHNLAVHVYIKECSWFVIPISNLSLQTRTLNYFLYSVKIRVVKVSTSNWSLPPLVNFTIWQCTMFYRGRIYVRSYVRFCSIFNRSKVPPS